ncbi:hypothetical protein [Paenibacillus terricola]|uniref:hypothetical protein n=1 Tax=Paenibacillus terricola TaxID=2763503 RepID=UPI0017466E5C|nr:hypothetical protein [Paenibacillus terricola]
MDSLTGPARDVVTRYNGLPPFELELVGGQEYGISLSQIQTVGVLNEEQSNSIRLLFVDTIYMLFFSR